MILMYVSSQSVSKSAIEDDGTKNKMKSRVRNLANKILQNIFSAKLYLYNYCTMLSKEGKKIKNWGIHPHFYINRVQNLTFRLNCWYIKHRVIVLQNSCQNTKCYFSLLYSICHQVQGHFHLNKSTVPWIESLITTQCILFCLYVGY